MKNVQSPLLGGGENAIGTRWVVLPVEVSVASPSAAFVAEYLHCVLIQLWALEASW
jgi:hypothetical protein